MSDAGPLTHATQWLQDQGPGALELLFRAIFYHPSSPILLADDSGNSTEVSVGTAQLLGLTRDQIMGRPLDKFADPNSASGITELWATLKEGANKRGAWQLLRADGTPRDVEFRAMAHVLPSRHLIVLQSRSPNEPRPFERPWDQDFALFLKDPQGAIVAWYSGAERIYGYTVDEIVGRPASILYPKEDADRIELDEQLLRVASLGHRAIEGWHVRQNETKFWANSITMALHDEDGLLQGFACVNRDFSERHERDEKLRRGRARKQTLPAPSRIAGVVSGEFDKVPEANEAFLEMVGYTREDLQSGRLQWPDLTPQEFIEQDECAHEEGLRFGACTPYEKEFVRKDGTRIPVLVATAVLKLSPFRWISFIQDLTERNQLESVEAEPTSEPTGFGEIVGQSPELKRMLRLVEMVAPTDAAVLILGETGTGKELVARAVHRMSPRAALPFVTLNCAAIPTGLLESELFGYERGAFTGALSQKIGRFEMAHHGTLFLDEVGDIPLDLQPKLLRALQEKAFERLGGTKTIPIDVRLVAATNRNLTQMMGDKLFRPDLYYRLKVFPINTPPLRDHPEDIPILVRLFTNRYAAKLNRSIKKIPTETMRALVSWPWPGNVRELENFIERSVILSSGTSLRAPLNEIHRAGAPVVTGETLEQVEREHILRVLRECGGVVTAAATRLGLHRTTLNAMMRKLGISRKDI